MAEAGNNRRAQRGPKPVSGGAAGFSTPAMPLLAASAAARLAGQVVSRLQSPYAAQTVRAPHPLTLWREVARRLGYTTLAMRPESPLARTPAPSPAVSPFGPQVTGYSIPPAQFVWRTQPVAQESDAPDLPVWRTSRPGPAPSQAPRIVSEPQPVPQITVPQPPPSARQEASPVPSAPPSFVPAVTVRIEYVPAPVIQPAPIIAPVPPPIVSVPLVPAAQRYATEVSRPVVDASRTLSAEVGRSLAPTTDLLSRMVRPTQADLPSPSAPAAEHVAEPQATPVQAMPAISVPVSPPAMPLAQPQAGRDRPESAEQQPEAPRQVRPATIVNRIIERIVEVLPLPEAVKQRFQTEPQLAQPIRANEADVPGVLPAITVPEPIQVASTQSEPAHEAVPVQATPPATIYAAETVSTSPELVSPSVQQVAEQVITVPIAQQDVVATQQEPVVSRGPGGLLSAILSRLRGGDTERSAPAGPAPLTLPWTSRNVQVPADEDEAVAAESYTVPSPSTPVYRPTVSTQVEIVPTVSSELLESPVIQAANSQSETEPLTTQAAVSVPSEPAVPVPVMPIISEPDSATPSYQLLPAVQEQRPTVSSEPGIAEDLSVSVPVWEALPEMAQQMATAHAPLPEIAPISPLVQGGLVARILARLGIVAPASTTSLPPTRGSFEMVLPRSESVPGSTQALEPSGVSAVPTTSPMPVARTIAAEGVAATLSASASSTPLPGRSITPTSSAPVYVPATPVQRLVSITSRLAAMTAPMTSSQSSPARTPFMGVLRSVSRMLQVEQPTPSAEQMESDLDTVEDYIEALNKIYGTPEPTMNRPLAVPYASFVAPGQSHAYFEDHSESDLTAGFASDSFGSGPENELEPSSPLNQGWDDFPALPGPQSGSQAVGWLTNYSWGEVDESPSAVADAGMWADVIGAAVGGNTMPTSGNIALSLAGEERSSPSDEQRPSNEDRSQGANLDDLADTIYSLIRQRLAIERERSFT